MAANISLSHNYILEVVLFLPLIVGSFLKEKILLKKFSLVSSFLCLPFSQHLVSSLIIQHVFVVLCLVLCKVPKKNQYISNKWYMIPILTTHHFTILLTSKTSLASDVLGDYLGS